MFFFFDRRLWFGFDFEYFSSRLNAPGPKTSQGEVEAKKDTPVSKTERPWG